MKGLCSQGSFSLVWNNLLSNLCYFVLYKLTKTFAYSHFKRKAVYKEFKVNINRGFFSEFQQEMERYQIYMFERLVLSGLDQTVLAHKYFTDEATEAEVESN